MHYVSDAFARLASTSVIRQAQKLDCNADFSIGLRNAMLARANSFVKWKKTADAVMLKIYGINTDDTGLTDEWLKSHWGSGQSPNEFVEWLGEKYDLISKQDMGIEGW